MFSFKGLNFGLGAIPLITDAETRSISAENPDGAKGGGAKAEPTEQSASRELGKGWKVRPSIPLEPGQTVALADIKGPGVIQHIWITVAPVAYDSCVLRMYWDDEKTPCVETPLGDFFCHGHGVRCKVNSLPIVVNPAGGFNSYWPMPFRKQARITIENQHFEKINEFFYQITYALTDVPESAGYFHAQYRRAMTTREHPEHTLLEGVAGKGHYVGTYLAWNQFSNLWWGEGEIKFYLDGDKEYPTLCGTGTEDYFGGAWGFGGETYSTAFLGYPQYLKEEKTVPRHGLYRWHVMDPVRFQKDLRVTIQALGFLNPGGRPTYEPLTDDIASVAYWYQTLPHGAFPAFPPRQLRRPR